VDRHALPAGVTSWDLADVFQNAVNLGVPVLGFALASRRPENPMGWLFLAAGLALGLNAFAGPYGLHAVRVAPGSLPAGRAVAWLSNWVFVIQAAMLAFLLLLFPNGRLRSRRWRPAAWFVAVVYTSLGLTVIVRATRFWAHPFRPFPDGLYPWVLTAILILLPATYVIGVAALVVRFALSSGDERLQLKWFAAAALLVVVATSLSSVTDSVAANVFQGLALLCLWVALGIAVLKYRLYDIDIVISKAVLYGSLAVFITAVYAALVVGVGTLAGNQRSPLLAACRCLPQGTTMPSKDRRGTRPPGQPRRGGGARGHSFLKERGRVNGWSGRVLPGASVRQGGRGRGPAARYRLAAGPCTN
jgi:hypothetical protein